MENIFHFSNLLIFLDFSLVCNQKMLKRFSNLKQMKMENMI